MNMKKFCATAALVLACFAALALPAFAESEQAEASGDSVLLPTGETVENNALSLDLSALKRSELDEAISCLKCLPMLIRADLGSERADFDLEDAAELQQALPDISFDFGFTLYGQSVNLSDSEINLSHISITDEGAAVREAMGYMPRLKYVDMDSCGLSNETMESIRDAFPDIKVVWRIWFSDAYSVRTDVERILASKPSVGGELNGEICKVLKYCTDVRYIDLGHAPDLDNIDFVTYMPNLEVAIIAMNAYTDVTPFASCPHLEYLEIQTNSISDLSPLSGLTELRHLNICNTLVTDISPLYGMTKLERLWIGALVHVPDEQIQHMQECAPNCLINTTVSDPTESAWRIIGYNDQNYVYTYHPRYMLLREQFGGYTDDAYSFSWNDPLY